MKKSCTPTNNALSIDTAIQCTPAVVTVPTCIDPFTYAFNTAVATSIDQGISVDEAMITLLNNGLLISNANAICCPDCNKAPFYSFTDMNGFSLLAGALHWASPEPNIIDYCCINIEASFNAYGKYVELMKANGITPDCCATDFTKCISTFPGYTQLTATGIVEVNTLEANTIICKLIDLLNTLPKGAYLESDIVTFLGVLLRAGFVAYCCDCTVVIGSVAVFMSYLESGACSSLVIPN